MDDMFDRRRARYDARADAIEEATFRDIVDHDAEHTIGDPVVETAAMIDAARERNAAAGIGWFDPVAEAEALLGGGDVE